MQKKFEFATIEVVIPDHGPAQITMPDGDVLGANAPLPALLHTLPNMFMENGNWETYSVMPRKDGIIFFVKKEKSAIELPPGVYR